MDVMQYLRRIDISEVQDCDHAELARLQYQHMLHVPFENLDVINQIPIHLDVEAYYKKVVIDHRGGFCYELNGLFQWLLKRLGFRCYLVSATVSRPDGLWAKSGSHACTIVELEQPYLVDVGFGDATRRPLPLNGDIQEDVSGIYRVRKVNKQNYDVERKQGEDGQWKVLNRVNTAPVDLQDFRAACHFNQTSAESSFTHKEVVTIATPDGRITLSGNTLTFTRDGDKQQMDVSDKDKSSIIKKYFHIPNRAI